MLSGVRLLCVVLCLVGWAAQASDDLRFEIRAFAVQGNSLLSTAQVAQAVSPFVSPAASFEDIQLALQALEEAYENAGYGSVRVLLPEQTLQDGVVRLQVIEARLREVLLQDPTRSDLHALLGRLPALQEGEPLNSRALSRQLRLANDNPSRQMAVVLQPAVGPGPGQFDAALRVAEGPAWRTGVTLDNTGNRSAGKARLGFVMQGFDLWDRDHQLTAQWQTSPESPEQLRVLGLRYQLPIRGLTSQLEFSLLDSKVDSGVLTSLGGARFDVQGKGRVAGIQLSHLLAAPTGGDRRFFVGLEHKQVDNEVVFLGSGASLVPDYTLTPITVGYSAGERQPGAQWSYELSLTHNLPQGRAGSSAVLAQVSGRGAIDAHYRIVRAQMQWQRRWAGHALGVRVRGQWSPDPLIATEQFTVGGAYSVRGFSEQAASADRGVQASLEWSLPAQNLLQALVFIDTAALRMQGAPGWQGLSSVGAGLRMNLGARGSLRLDAAQIVDGAPGHAAGTTRVHMGIVWLF